MKKMFLGIVILVMIAASFNTVLAAGNKLDITSITAYVNGKKKSVGLTDGSIDAEPEDSLKVKITIENLYNEDEVEDGKIEDITVTGKLEGIDDGDDLEEESSEFDLREERSKTITLYYKIPLEVDEGGYTFSIEAQGDDANSSKPDHKKDVEFNVEVEKEKHKLKIYKAAFSSDTVKCGGTADLSLGVINIGENEEEDIEQTIKNDLLGVSSSEKYTLSESVGDDDNKRLKSYKFNIPVDAKEGMYQFAIEVKYGSKSESTYVDLNVKCEQKKEEEKKEEPKTTQYVCADGKVVDNLADCITEEPKEEEFIPITEEEKEEEEEGSYTFLIVGSIILVILIIAIVIISAAKK